MAIDLIIENSATLCLSVRTDLCLALGSQDGALTHVGAVLQDNRLDCLSPSSASILDIRKHLRERMRDVIQLSSMQGVMGLIPRTKDTGHGDAQL